MRKEMNDDFLPKTGFIKLSQVLKFIPVSKSTWLRGEKEGRYPRARQISDRRVAYPAEEIHELMNDLRSNKGEC